jgi:hypothetical protein
VPVMSRWRGCQRPWQIWYWVALPRAPTYLWQWKATDRPPTVTTMDARPDWAAWKRHAIACLHERPRPLPRDPITPPPLQPVGLIRALAAADVRWILNGSAALHAAGVDEVIPGDLDIVPDVSIGNLRRLGHVLERLDAVPHAVPKWEFGLTIEDVKRWRPRPACEANLNHRFVTEHGILDVVPRLTGTFEELQIRAWPGHLMGAAVLVADLEPILTRLRHSSRHKDQQRWRAAVAMLTRRRTPGSSGPP